MKVKYLLKVMLHVESETVQHMHEEVSMIRIVIVHMS